MNRNKTHKTFNQSRIALRLVTQRFHSIQVRQRLRVSLDEDRNEANKSLKVFILRVLMNRRQTAGRFVGGYEASFPWWQLSDSPFEGG